MSPRNVKRLTNACGSALVGALGGAILAAFGNSISHSALGAGAILVLSTILGVWTGRLSGAIVGAVLGLVVVVFGQVVGGTTLAIVLTIATCAALGGWLSWAQDGPMEFTDTKRSVSRHGRKWRRRARNVNHDRVVEHG